MTIPILVPQTASVGSGTEIPGDSANVVNADFDRKADTIPYTIDDPRFSTFANVQAFIGYVLSNADGVIHPITGVEIREGSNMLGGAGRPDLF
ncbi:MAG: hypothetical protein ACFBRM_02220, partial [Pikeienuella sp.]